MLQQLTQLSFHMMVQLKDFTWLEVVTLVQQLVQQLQVSNSSSWFIKLPYDGLAEGFYLVGSGNTGVAASLAAIGKLKQLVAVGLAGGFYLVGSGYNRQKQLIQLSFYMMDQLKDSAWLGVVTLVQQLFQQLQVSNSSR